MILSRQSGLGRGLGALIPPVPIRPSGEPVSGVAQEQSDPDCQVIQIPIHQIQANPYQPRMRFEHGKMEDLIMSIREHGVLQPLIVTQLSPQQYQLIAGERRLRASVIAELATVPAIVRKATDRQKLELSLIENIQRADLNPLEEAKAFVCLMEEFALTQDDLSRKVGKSRPQVANTIRLLQLPDEIQQALMEEKITTSHARTLLSIPNDEQRQELFQSLLQQGFTVRQVEERVQHGHASRIVDANIAAVESRLRETFRCRVDLKPHPKGGGEVRFRVGSEEEWDALLGSLCHFERSQA